MKRSLLALLGVLALACSLVLSTPAATFAQCLSATVTGDGTRDYLGCADLQTWATARTKCQGLGTGWDLTSISNSTENTLAGTVGSSSKWIGFNDITTEGTFVWADGTPNTYTSWNTGEPNNSGNEDCTVFVSATLWNDLACTSTRGFICEGPAGCGNKYKTSTEACDDGNTMSGDGCSSTCTIEPGFTCVTTTIPNTCSAGCPAGGTASTNGGYDYIYCSTNTSWANARDYCDATGAGWDLAWIDSAAENTYIRTLSAVTHWIGMNDIATEGTMVWYGSHAKVYTNWNGGEPNDSGGNEDCTQVRTDGKWNDINCTNNQPFVCKSVSGGCGNGAVLGGEACDDGDNTSGDGCSATCTIETGWTCTGSPSICTPVCASGKYRFRTISGSPYTYHEYYYCATAKTFANAETTCGNLGTNWHLASIGSLAERTYVQGITSATHWIGFNDRTTEGSFVWVSGEANAYTNWNSGEPNDSGGNEDCTQEATGGGWNDANCAGTAAFVCEQNTNTAKCGNSVIGDSEECDDGNTNNGDGCSSTCRVQTGWSCTIPVDNGAASICTMPAHVLLEGSRLLNVGGTPVLEWTSASESGAVGFFVTRFDEAHQRWVPVHDGMLVAPPDAVRGAVYQLVDRGGSVRGRTQYEIEEYDRGGRRVTLEAKVHTPIVDGAVTVPVGGFRVTARPPSRRTTTVPTPGGVLAVRAGEVPTAAILQVRDAGVQTVSVADLASALNRSAHDVTAALEAGNLALRDQDHAVAWAFDPSSGTVSFVGEASDSAYSSFHPYMASLASGAVLPVVDQTHTTADVGLGRVVTEVEHDTFAGLVVGPDPNSDYWFDAVLSAGSPTQSKFDRDVDLAQVPAQAVTLSVRVYGAWNVDAENPQHVSVLVNGAAVGAFDVANVGAMTKAFSVPASRFVAGKNTLSLSATSEGAAGMGGLYVDGFTVDAVTELDLGADHVRFTAVSSGPLAAVLAGEDVRVFDVTAQTEILPASAAVPGATEVSFVTEKGHDYVVAAASSVHAVTASDLRASFAQPFAAGTDPDLIIVVPRAMRAAADALATLRRDGGLSVTVVTLEDLWDRYAAGLPRPTVITDLLKEGADHWKRLPRYMVLVGDGTFDYRHILGEGPGAVPPLMVKTSFGLYASDSSLADVDGDGVADLAVGRLPAHDLAEANAMVSRIAAYGGRQFADYTYGATLVAGKQRGADFGATVQALATTLPKKADVHTILADTMSFEDARQDVMDALDQGTFWFHYAGHGGLDRMDDDGLLTAEDVNGLDNGGLAPIVTGMTCSISRYEVPGMASLGDSLLLGDKGGAIAVWAPTGVSTSFESAKVGERFGELLLRDAANGAGTVRLGDVVLRAQRQSVHDALAPADMMSVFTLLGDPSMALPDLQDLREAAPVVPPTDEPSTPDAGVDVPKSGGMCGIGRTQDNSLMLFVFGAVALILTRRRRP